VLLGFWESGNYHRRKTEFGGLGRI